MTTKLLDNDREDSVRMSISDAQALGEKSLRSLGYSSDEATTITTHLVDASTWGYEFAGLPRILVIAQRPELKNPRTPVTIVKQSPVSALLDGGNHVGYISLNRAVDTVIEKVRSACLAVNER
jgi:LDH2 family malate/lactate/ureidoglycolate dehydrogenase